MQPRKSVYVRNPGTIRCRKESWGKTQTSASLSFKETRDIVAVTVVRDILLEIKETVCGVCHMELNEPEDGVDNTIVSLNCCGLIFHRRCLNQWLAIQPRCPVCSIGVEDTQRPVKYTVALMEFTQDALRALSISCFFLSIGYIIRRDST